MAVAQPVAACSEKHDKYSGRAVLNISKARFTVTQKSWCKTVGKKDIIKGVSISMKSGETLAVMGPSGAGKTTFMDLLTLEGSGGVRTGYVDLNGEPITQEVFKRCCAYVPQHDSGWAFLTCRETLEYAASFYTTEGGAKQREERVQELLKTMGLESCRDTKVGNEFLKGLSGGQRRRLSLAVAFLKDPLVVFLDEVTSGLDAASAASIAKFLQDLARAKDVVIACTIHQPSAKVFAGFDRLLLLSGGRVAYSGRVGNAAEHFLSLGMPVPEHENPADFYLDAVNADFTDRERVEKVLSAWSSTGSARAGSGVFEVKAVYGRRPQRRCVEVAVLFKRMLVLAVRDPTVYLSRIVCFLVACSFFSVVYLKSRDREQSQVFNRIWLMIWHMGVPSCMSLVACLGYNIEFAAVRREAKAGMYRLGSYVAAQLLVQIPLVAVLSVSAIGFSGYVLAQWNGSAFFEVLLAHSLLLFGFECFAQLAAVAFDNPLIGMFQVINLWFASFLFGGFLVPEDDVPWPLRALATVSPMKWATKAAFFSELRGTTWAGAVLDARDARGFSCPGASSASECYGATGAQVLQTMRATAFKHLTPESELTKDWAILLGVAVAFKLLYVAMAAVRCRGGQTVKPPEHSGDVTPSLGAP